MRLVSVLFTSLCVIAGCANEPTPPPEPVLACEHTQTGTSPAQLSSAPIEVVLFGSSLTKPTESIGHVTCHASQLESGIEGLRTEARALGADGVVNVNYGLYTPATGPELYQISGTAVVFQDAAQVSEPEPAAEPKPEPQVRELTDDEIRQVLIRQSIMGYSRNCPCPYNSASNGSRCGGRSAYSRPGGYSPLCYPQDVSDETVREYRRRLQLHE